MLAGINDGIVASDHSSGTIDLPGAGLDLHAGGLVGLAEGLISESYATGAVTSQQGNVGGLVNLTLFSDIERSFATGHLQAPAPHYGKGGIAAQILEPGDPGRDTVWDTQTRGTNIAVASGPNGGTVNTAQGLTTAQMSTPSSFSAAYDFGPNGVWAMPAGATHPILRWQLAP
ncbi:GLUG motif-containing protein [Paraburkholderia kirstenboschensis]|uniref:GLUG motif-containing protein n=1 Tax=Paraburkholderia kirstenboschensis TaxID=1245436 RepID=A0ABZ0E8V2_9BURK|nr:GLUG motif-containing protein [Paraburkholderia kirstenboschensis]WOD13662.1 GLUG motif-containing protein [Paraburkholderia kirstenboschensis]